ncbi:MAG: hypothetical protein V4667_13140 [Bacteroidota bacterium]
MKKLLLILGALSFVFLLTNAQSNSTTQISKQNNIDTLFMDGVLVKKQFVNKAGRQINEVFDLYLVNENIETFVKISGGNYKTKDLEKYLGKQMLYAVEMRDGNWDTQDGNHEMQSRIGKYCVILKISEN